MKITNLEAVTFFNNVSGMKDKRLPVTLLFAVKHNLNLFANQLKAYEESRQALIEQVTDECEQTQEMMNLLYDSVEYDVKTVSMSVIEKIDGSDNYDALTYIEIEAMMFMITEE